LRYLNRMLSVSPFEFLYFLAVLCVPWLPAYMITLPFYYHPENQHRGERKEPQGTQGDEIKYLTPYIDDLYF